MSRKLLSEEPVPRNNHSDVIVIGAGVIGAAVAYYLCRRGLRVTLLEAREVAAGTSGACDGFVFLQSKRPGIHLELALASRRLFSELEPVLPVSMEFRKCGGLVAIETKAEMAAMEEFVREQRRLGLEVTLLDGNQLRQLEPHLSAGLLGATFCPLDGQVNPLALTLGLALGARDLGARLLTGAPVQAIETKGGRAAIVHTNGGTFHADAIVNAAGVQAPAIARMVGLDLPIKPRRGQLLVTEATRPLLRCCLLSAQYIAAKYDPELAKGGGEGCSIEQTDRGNFLLGSTREFVGYDRSTTIAGLQAIGRRVRRLLPPLGELHVIRAFAGLRPYTPDGLPILGPVEQVPGFHIAAGHEGDGIALAPVTGWLLAQLITEGRTDVPLGEFRLERFAAGGKRRS